MTWSVKRCSLMHVPLVLALATSLGCGDDEEQVAAATGTAAADSAAAKPAVAATAATTTATGPAPVRRALRDSDFVESEQNRDPFRSLLVVAKGAKAAAPAQRSVLMPNTPITAMKLIAIVTGIAQPRAMIVDEKGVGYVATRGDFVGAAEVVQSGGAENLPVTLNWRVDRIRENEVVLNREDPTGPNRPPLTRVIALHGEEDEQTAIGAASSDT